MLLYKAFLYSNVISVYNIQYFIEVLMFSLIPIDTSRWSRKTFIESNAFILAYMYMALYPVQCCTFHIVMLLFRVCLEEKLFLLQSSNWQHGGWCSRFITLLHQLWILSLHVKCFFIDVTICVCVCAVLCSVTHSWNWIYLTTVAIYCWPLTLTFTLPPCMPPPNQESRASSRASEYSSEEGDEDEDYEDDYEEDEGSESEEDED